LAGIKEKAKWIVTTQGLASRRGVEVYRWNNIEVRLGRMKYKIKIVTYFDHKQIKTWFSAIFYLIERE
jgi:hypothetical protein